MLKRTPLFEIHKALGARLVPFAGWEMPVQYAGVIDEHLAVRSACGLFDVSHMGEIEVSGDGAIDFVQFVMTNDVERITDGQCQYTLLCNEKGGVVDDTIVYRYNIDRYLFVVNASNAAKVFDWFKAVQAREKFPDVSIDDLSASYAQLAVQGPRSVEVMRPLLDVDPAGIKTFRFHMGLIGGEIEALVSRTGYTGEDGFEIYLDPSEAAAAWRMVMEAGAAHGIAPIGLGARDTLRLEMGYPLYGHELGDDITPVEAGLSKYVKYTRDFVGREVLEAQSNSGSPRRLIGLKMQEGAGVPRAGYEVRKGGARAGVVTSGTSSPSLKSGIAMALVDSAFAGPGEFEVMIRDRAHKASSTPLPFYKR